MHFENAGLCGKRFDLAIRRDFLQVTCEGKNRTAKIGEALHI